MNARLSEIKANDAVEVCGFDCMDGKQIIQEDSGRLYIACSMGRHYLEGQLDDDGDSLVGIFKVNSP